jgi:aryl-alcohol dehydrogenase-like predicted oxidoreductase
VRYVDTAANYFGFASHSQLARVAGDLMPQFAVSTKVGFFPAGTGTEHSLDPCQLRDAVWRSVDELGIRPAVIFLHNPEQSLSDRTPGEAAAVLRAACSVLAEAAAFGLCDQWGIATWSPADLLPALDMQPGWPNPDVLMVRAGLTVDAATLAAADRLATLLGVDPVNRWGMSPFAGRTTETAWRTTNLAPFLEPGQPHTSLQAACRLAYELPHVTHLAVGTDNPVHLRELVVATELAVSAQAVGRYRQLISNKVMAATR